MANCLHPYAHPTHLKTIPPVFACNADFCILMMYRQKRLAKQALSVEQSAQSAPSHLADSRYSPDDTAWETVVKKGNKTSKGNSTAASKPSPTAAQPAGAVANQSLQPQHSGLSQTGRTASGVLLPLASHQQSGGVQQPGGGRDTRARSADPSSVDDGFSGDSVAAGHSRQISQDEDMLSTRSSMVERSVLQHQSKPEGVDSSAAAQEASARPGLPAAAPVAKPSNWAGLLKPPQQQQQQQQDWQHEEDGSSQKAAAPIVSEGAFPQLATAASIGLDHNLTPSQQSASELSLSLEKSQGLSQAPSEAELPSVPSSPFASMSQPQRTMANNGSETTVTSSAASQQRSQVDISQQLHANAAIWGTGLSTGTLSGIQLHQQPQVSVNPFQAASAAPATALWDPQSLQPGPAPGSAPPRPSQAPPPTKPTVKSMLPVNAQPFVPQARLSTSASQGQRLPFVPQDTQQQPQAAAMTHQQHRLPTTQSPFMQGHSFGRSQQPPTSAAGVYSSSGSFDSLARPQQQQQQGHSLSRGFDGNAALQQMQHQRLLQQQQSQQQQQRQQAGLLPRQQQQQQQQQLADIWLQPSVGVQQNTLPTRSAGSYTSHQQPAGSKGKAAASGPFAAHQPPASAFHHHQQRQQSPFVHEQYSGLQQQQQQQGRGSRAGPSGPVNGNHYGAASMNGMTNGHLSSAGTQSEDDELLSGVFAKVWEDNLQVSCTLCTLRSMRVPATKFGFVRMKCP